MLEDFTVIMKAAGIVERCPAGGSIHGILSVIDDCLPTAIELKTVRARLCSNRIAKYIRHESKFFSILG